MLEKMQRKKKLWYIYDLLNFLYLVMVNHICDHQAISSEGQCGGEQGQLQ